MATYIQKKITSDLTPYDVFNLEISPGSGTDTTQLVSLNGNQTRSGGFITPSGTPNSDQWESSGTWTVELEEDAGNMFVDCRVRIVRLDSAGTILQSGAYTAAQATNSDLIFNPVSPGWTLSEEDVGNRIAIELEFENTSSMSQGTSFWVGEATNEVITDITENNVSFTTISGDMDLFIQGYDLSSGSIDLFTQGDDTSSGNIDLFIDGKPSSDIDLFTQGHQQSSGNIDLFIHGSETTNSLYRLYVTDEDDDLTLRVQINGFEIEYPWYDSVQTFQQDVVVDEEGRRVYVVDPQTGTIRSNNYDATDDQLVVTSGQMWCITVDPLNGHLFWGDISNNEIGRSNLDGSNPTAIVVSSSGFPVGDPRGITIDVVGQKIYWTDNGLAHIAKCNLDGSNMEVIISGLNNPVGIEYNPVDKKLYWGDFTERVIYSANRDGSGSGLVIDFEGGGVYGVSISLFTQELCIVDSVGQLRIYDIDGSNERTFPDVNTLFNTPRGIDVEHKNFANLFIQGSIDSTQASGTFDLFVRGQDLSSGNMDLFVAGLPSGDIDLFVGGQDTTSSSVDLFINGFAISSSGMDLFTQGYQLSSGDMDLFIQGEVASSGDLDLFIRGFDNASGSINLFVAGKPSGDIPLFISSLNLSSNNLDLFIAGKPSGDMGLFEHGHEVSSDNVDLSIVGLPSGDIDLFIEGEDGSSNNLDLFIRGLDNTSGSIDLFIDGHGTTSGNIDLFIAGKPSGDIPLFISSLNVSSNNLDLSIVGKPSGDIDLFEFGHDSSSGNADLFVGGKQTTSGALNLFVDGHQTSSGNTNLFVDGQGSSSGTIDLFVSGVAGQPSGTIDLFIAGSGVTPASGQIDLFIGSEGSSSGNIDLFVNGLEPIPPLVCPPLDTGASIQITASLVKIYQDRIDALINQLGKSVLLEFDAAKQPCPNCIFDPIRNRSTGIYISGGPRPFRRGRQCPWCKGRGFEETVSTKCIEALLKWNPKDSSKYGISLSNHKSVVRIKTFITEADDLIRAKTAVADYQEIDTTVARVRLIKNPIPVGLQESRYCISFWELI